MPGFAGGLIIGIGGSVVSGAAAQVFSPLIDATGYAVNSALPIKLPTIDMLIGLKNRGLINPNFLNSVGSMLGASFTRNDGANPGVRVGQICWDKIVEAAKDFPGISHWIALYLRGWLKDENALRDKLVRAGTDPDFWIPHLESMRMQLPAGELQVARNRGWVDRFDYDRTLERFHGLDGPTRKIANKLRQWIPTPQDLIRFSVREAFNEEAVTKLNLDLELDQNPDFGKWMEAQGAGIVEHVDDTGTLQTMNVPKMFWRAHWDLPSPTQAFAMGQRLRPTGGPGGGPRDPSKLVMRPSSLDPDELTVESLLKSADYAPVWRGRLQAISYLTLGRREAKAAYANGVLGARGQFRGGVLQRGPAEFELDEIFQDLGLNLRDARVSTETVAATQKKADTKDAYSIVRKNTLTGYRLGILTDQQFLDALTSIDVSLSDAQTQLAVVAWELAMRDGKAGISAIRKGFLSGAIGVDELDGLLGQAGVPDSRRLELISRWGLELQGERREIAANMVIDYTTRGLLDAAEASRRLTNLNYNRGAIGLMLSQSAQDIARLIEKERLSQIRDAKARAREAMHLANQARLEAERLRKLAAGSATKVDVLRWYKNGWISYDLAYNRLIVLKFLPADAERLLAENAP